MRFLLAGGALAVVVTSTVACTSGTAPPDVHPVSHAPQSNRASRTSAPPTHPSSPGHSRPTPHRTLVFMNVPPISHPIPTKPVRTAAVRAPGGTTYPVKVWERVTTHRCTGNNISYGSATAYLRRHPCASLTRMLGTSRAKGKSVGFAQDTSVFRDASAAAGMRAIIGSGGSGLILNGGDVLNLFFAGYGLPSGPQSAPAESAFVATVRGKSVTTFEAWDLVDPTRLHDPTLAAFARDVRGRV